MHYFERLIRRALAVPRDMPGRIFDPFEQIAPWLIDPSLALNPAERISSDAPAEAGTPPAQAAASVKPSSAPDKPPETVATVQPSPPEPPIPAAIRAVERFLDGPSRESKAAAAELRPDAPMAKADAFMTALNVKRIAPETAEPARAAPPEQRITPLELAPPARHGLEPTPHAPKVQLVRPITPRRSPPERPLPPSSNASAPAVPAREHPASRRPTAVTAPQSIVTRTVLVAPSTRPQLDDLAHSSGISHFGIGQG
jgi:hypothetical protein